MDKAKTGDTVKVHYTGKLKDGTVFDSSRERDPLAFKIGEGQIISGFEQAVIGMTPGQSTTATVETDDAYGQHRKDLVWEIERKRLPNDLEPEVGQRLETVFGDGRKVLVTIADVSESNVTIDANHPLAGKDLVFDIELLEIL